MFDFIGLMGSILFAICWVPQVVRTIKSKNAEGISGWFLFLFLIGAVCFTIYALMSAQYVLLPNFVGGAIGGSIVTYYKIANARKRGPDGNS